MLVQMGERVSQAGGLRDAPLPLIIRGIGEGRWAEQVDAVRAVVDHKARQEAKASLLPYFLAAARFDGARRTECMVGGTGLLALDVDDIDADNAVIMREHVKGLPMSTAAFLSPSWGLKIICAVEPVPSDARGVAAAWAAASEALRRAYSLQADKSGKDACRATFISHDDGAWCRPPLKALAWEYPPERKAKPYRPEAHADMADVAGKLAGIPADDRLVWLTCLMALKSEFGEAAEPLARSWSQSSTKYDERGFDVAWRSLKPEGGVTIGSLYYLWKENGNGATTAGF